MPSTTKRLSTKRKRSRKHSPFKLSGRETVLIENWQALLGLSPKLTAIVDACAMSTVYDRLEKGDYEAVKDGTKTIITTASILARRARLARAEYKSAQVSA
jgi:hypothetical protein